MKTKPARNVAAVSSRSVNEEASDERLAKTTKDYIVDSKGTDRAMPSPHPTTASSSQLRVNGLAERLYFVGKQRSPVPPADGIRKPPNSYNKGIAAAASSAQGTMTVASGSPAQHAKRGKLSADLQSRKDGCRHVQHCLVNAVNKQGPGPSGTLRGTCKDDMHRVADGASAKLGLRRKKACVRRIRG
jgi:hypothetical protein